MRVLQLVDTLAPGGRERLVVDLANTFAERGLASFVCETRYSGLLAAELHSDVGHYELQRRRAFDFSALQRYAHFVKKNQIDIIHCHGRAVAQFAGLCKTLFRISAAHLFHDHMPGVDETTPAPRALQTIIPRTMEGIVVVSEELQHFALARLRFDAERVWHIPNGISVDRFSQGPTTDLRRAFNIPPERPVLVCIANVRPQKDYVTLLRAIAALKHSVALVIVGNEGDPITQYARSCRQLCVELGLDQVVHHAGQRTDVPSILRGADIGVLTSRYESGPLVIAEYAAAGLPIVATSTGDITLGFRGRPGCEIVSPGDPGAVCAAIDRVITLGVAEQQRLGQELREHCRRTYSIGAMADALGGIYAAVRLLRFYGPDTS